jgi:hypothetical protein
LAFWRFVVLRFWRCNEFLAVEGINQSN